MTDEARLRELWTRKGCPQARQDALWGALASVVSEHWRTGYCSTCATVASLPCVYCGGELDPEDYDASLADGAAHHDCADAIRVEARAQAEDWRLDDPRRGQP